MNKPALSLNLSNFFTRGEKMNKPALSLNLSNVFTRGAKMNKPALWGEGERGRGGEGERKGFFVSFGQIG
ncbi:hypothetical protein [Arthrospira platensis]|uniref:hypothetical protein n=1 Tax=Limnospira TaxID=2596745 RepID=UPI00049FF1DB|nr:hypothetical protein [Arthrospira platensis]AMW27347.1 hypothetical protein AP285_04445 [Arthrospira platensis YZ]KDR57694.1 hypothetical protein APPUASWS_009480 [Arthrospira platensis str. Paraca]MBD2710699.1 hypothetical protein [Arthrospira platensis FACHB-835]MDF2211104.1 hypothetical protein [Arthrospira platensis NCB002]MDT9309062.1 hypothetical protein [Limnospira sp. Paracas R14]QQW30092.1 hypothetical protein AP9108_04715 [Arthrospira sp. PCC 9108]